jgi:hypothetical protein
LLLLFSQYLERSSIEENSDFVRPASSRRSCQVPTEPKSHALRSIKLFNQAEEMKKPIERKYFNTEHHNL